MSLLDSLPKILPFSKDQSSEDYYFALNIGAHTLTASVWGLKGKSLVIINTATSEYTDEEDLIEAANLALDEALKDFEPEPTQILFGVPDSWLQDDNLKDQYLNLLKKLVSELDVSPLAYVSTTHAICHLLQKETGIPSTIILADLSDPLVVTVVKGGKILGTKTLKRGDDLPLDIEKALLSFTNVEVLPSKISIYGGEDLEKHKDQLLSFNWMNNLPFLHLPKVDILPSDVQIIAISLAGASEINPDATYNSHSSHIPESNSHPGKSPHSEHANLGFISGDITRMNKMEKEDIPEIDEEMEDLATVPPQRHVPMRRPAGGYPEEIREEPYPSNSMPSKFRAWLDYPLALIGFGRGVSHPGAVPRRSLFKSPKLMIALAILLILVGLYVFLPKATVTILIDPRILEKDAQVTADPSVTSVDDANKKIPGKIIETEVNGTDKGTATGKKQIGDPAKGTVIIYNKSAGPKSFSQGTVLQGPNNLTFTLNSNVDNIASPSAEDGTWGKATASVTATQIGPDSNLQSGTQLTLKGQSSSDVSAKVDQAFSGGTSKDVGVVTSDDQKKLKALLASELRKKAQDQLQGKLTGDEKILGEGLNEEIGAATFSKNVNDQASDFTLNMTVHYKGTAYSDADLKQMISKLVQTNVPDGYELKLSDTETQADVSKLEKDGRLIFLARFKAKLTPKMDLEKIKSQIKGKTPTQAADLLKSMENVVGSEINIKPNLPGPLQRLPFLSKNISIEVSAK